MVICMYNAEFKFPRVRRYLEEYFERRKPIQCRQLNIATNFAQGEIPPWYNSHI